jgi:hypothetical protein
MILRGEVEPHSLVRVDLAEGEEALSFSTEPLPQSAESSDAEEEVTTGA